MVQGLGYGIAVVGVVAIGQLHVATGGWREVFLVLLALVGLLLVGGWFACRPTMLGADPRTDLPLHKRSHRLGTLLR